MKKQVLIAGGGIGGLAAGIGAARAGWEVRLFERATAFSEVGAGVQLGPNVVRRLQAWGLQAPLQAVAAFPQRLSVRCALSGAQLAALPLGATAVQRYGAAYATIHRADLHTLLLEGLRQYPDVHLNLDQTIESHRESEGAVTVRTYCNKVIEGDALVGADGVRSRTRAQLLGDGPPRVTGHLAYRVVVPQQALPERLRATEVTAWMGPRLHVVQYPVRRGELQNVVVIVEGPAPADLDTWDHAANAADLEVALAGTCTALQDLLRGVPEAGGGWRLWPLADRPPVRSPAQMAQGLVALLGDAAHPMRPYLAQGAGMAIEDAAELQRALAMHDLDVPLRLTRYALNRWQRNARVQARSQRNGRIFHATGPVRWGRDLSLRLLGERLLDLPWLYRGDGSSASLL
ncbi:FAD-dependent monooxygenase [Paenacidovorax monticola]|uniref:FAD-dependent monooxygenase n=1 Tax=Paenacidovorax monticola TaxID=1926868 RepID=A0A7H0HFE5_9BURK|nr:FAD-dependent monooxygenase [Paenacidovorax monticola]QNP59261.1 FAD-dependent monooxygenase [Paenacidovorax monticola]